MTAIVRTLRSLGSAGARLAGVQFVTNDSCDTREVSVKIWRNYGSAHSAHLSVVASFKKVEDAKLAREVMDDFLRYVWLEADKLKPHIAEKVVHPKSEGHTAEI